MNVNIIHSGSSGNCAVIDDTIIIDMGWNVTPQAEYVLLTHHHTDHTKHLQNVGGLPIYCTQETADKLVPKFPYTAFNIIEPNVPFELGNYIIIAWELKHDAPCVAYDIYKSGESERIFFGTDFNTIVDESNFIRCLEYKMFNALYIEANNTLDPTDFADVYFGDEKPRDEFHRRKSYQNHCNVGYLTDLFTRAGYSADNRFTEPITLLHKSSYYYTQNAKQVVELCKIANVTNPLY